MYNKIQLLKTSVFFLSHWTKRFQRSIAHKLVRQIYSPEEPLLQPLGKERIFILHRGTVDIQARFFDRKRLGVLQVDPNKDVHFNVYGYSSLISGLPIHLQAVAR
jgi:hypothetical protein